MSIAKKKLILANSNQVIKILGESDRNLPELENKFGVNIYCFQNPSTGKYELEIVGRKSKVMFAIKKLAEMTTGKQTEVVPPKKEHKSNKVIYTTYNGRQIVPLSKNQRTYVEYINSYDVVIAIGPAGTGKTFLAVAEGLNALESGKVSRIVLTRPVVEAGEKLGFLPGDLYEKINPYLKPLYDAFYTMLGPDRFRRYRENETIEIIPLAYMRGRTIEDAFIVLDEAQNTVPEQMKMFLTRLGMNSQAVITGDITQIDLEDKMRSGLVLSEKILKGIQGIKFIHFTEEDVVRHKLVKEIIKAYEIWEKKNA